MKNIASKGCSPTVPLGDKKSLDEIERSIIKKYRKHIWTKFIKAINDYKLIEEGDRIAVAISGGKDSLLMAKLFSELKKHGKIKFEVHHIVMDPGYHEDVRKLLLDNLNYLNINATIFSTDIFDVAGKIAKDYPCYMCARMRRGSLYQKAQDLHCNKLALGHHFNDVIETTLLNVLYSGNFKTMMPKLKADNFKNMELIRPLYYIEEGHIEKFINNAGIWPLNCACMIAADKTGNKRYEIKKLISDLKRNFSNVDISIFRASQNVNINSILGYEKDGKSYSFLDFYDDL